MSKMSKCDFELIAEVLQSVSPPQSPTTDAYAMQVWNDTVKAFANRLASTNGMFKRDRFIRACQPGANVKARS